MLGNIIGGRFRASKCPTWKFLIWNQQNLHKKENDQHLVQLLPNKLGSLFISVLLVSIKVFDMNDPIANLADVASNFYLWIISFEFGICI